MYKDGYLSYNETATNEAISDASHAGGYCNDIQTCISNIKSNAKFLQEFYLGLEESDGNFNSIYSNIQ